MLSGPFLQAIIIRIYLCSSVANSPLLPFQEWPPQHVNTQDNAQQPDQPGQKENNPGADEFLGAGPGRDAWTKVRVFVRAGAARLDRRGRCRCRGLGWLA